MTISDANQEGQLDPHVAMGLTSGSSYSCFPFYEISAHDEQYLKSEEIVQVLLHLKCQKCDWYYYINHIFGN